MKMTKTRYCRSEAELPMLRNVSEVNSAMTIWENNLRNNLVVSTDYTKPPVGNSPSEAVVRHAPERQECTLADNLQLVHEG